MRALADVLHQGMHGTLAKNRDLNFFLATFPSGYLVGQSFTGYDSTHGSHHRYLGDRRLDPDYIGLIEQGLYGEGLSAANVRRYLLRIVHPVTTLSYLKYLAKNRILPPQETRQERLVRIFYLLSLITTLLLLGWGKLILLYWVIPLLTTANWIGLFLEISEHYPLIEVNHENESEN